MRDVAAGLGAVAALLFAYAYGGTFAAFVGSVTLFAGAALAVCLGLAPRSAARRLSTPRGGQSPPTHEATRPSPGASALGESTTVTRRRSERHESTQLVRLEAEILAGLRKRRIYQASVRPQLFDLGMSLLAQQKRVDVASLRLVVGEELWPLLDPAAAVDARAPEIDVRQLDILLTRLEGIA